MDSNRIKNAVKLYNSLPHSKIILCDNDDLSFEINKFFRQLYFKLNNTIQISEIVILRNLKSHQSINCGIGVVLDVSFNTIQREVKLNSDNTSPAHKLTWRWVKVVLFDCENKTSIIEGYIIDELINNTIPITMIKKLLDNDFQQRHSDQYNKSVRHDKFYNILDLNYGYCCNSDFILDRKWKNIVLPFNYDYSKISCINVHNY